jgi:hypothetical protein
MSSGLCKRKSSAVSDNESEVVLRELLTNKAFHTRMRKHIVVLAALVAASMGVALAQVGASGSTYFLDVDTARYAGPATQRLALRLGDSPRHISISTQDSICVQLNRDTRDNDVISARVRALGADEKVAEVRLVGPDISPGTYRSTPWGLLLRALPDGTEASPMIKAMGTETAPVCTL